MRLSARQHATARILDAETGRVRSRLVVRHVGGGPGLLILDGLIAVDTRVADRTATELVGRRRPAPAAGRGRG